MGAALIRGRRLFEGGAYSRAALIKKLIERIKNDFKKPVKYLKKVIYIGKIWLVIALRVFLWLRASNLILLLPGYMYTNRAGRLNLKMNWHVKRMIGKKQMNITSTMMVFKKNR